jgi:cytochrome c oxidase subunit I
VDHKQPGLLYIIIALLFFLASGLQAAVIRIQLMYPNNDLVTPQTFNRLFTMHGTTMVFFVGMPFIAGWRIT